MKTLEKINSLTEELNFMVEIKALGQELEKHHKN